MTIKVTLIYISKQQVQILLERIGEEKNIYNEMYKTLCCGIFCHRLFLFSHKITLNIYPEICFSKFSIKYNLFPNKFTHLFPNKFTNSLYCSK